jgi:SNF2 family DNA or RNA helicase
MQRSGSTLACRCKIRVCGVCKRQHAILHTQVQRKDDSILRSILPPKEELVVFTCLSDVQIALYEDLLAHHKSVCPAAVCDDPDTAKCRHLLSAHSYVQRLVNHPDVLRHAVRTASIQKKRKEEDAARKAQLQQRFAQSAGDASAGNSTKASAQNEPDGGGAHVVHLLDSDDDDEGGQKRQTASEPARGVAEGGTHQGHGADTQSATHPGEASQADASLGACGCAVSNAARDSSAASPQADETCEAAASGGKDECKGTDKTDKNTRDIDDDDDDDKDDDSSEINIPEFDQLGLEWAEKVLLAANYDKCVRELSGKMVVLMQIMIECKRAGERCLVFSQSVVMLDCVQAFIDKFNNAQPDGSERIVAFRLDGSTAQQDRQVCTRRPRQTWVISIYSRQKRVHTAWICRH